MTKEKENAVLRAWLSQILHFGRNIYFFFFFQFWLNYVKLAFFPLHLKILQIWMEKFVSADCPFFKRMSAGRTGFLCFSFFLFKFVFFLANSLQKCKTASPKFEIKRSRIPRTAVGNSLPLVFRACQNEQAPLEVSCLHFYAHSVTNFEYKERIMPGLEINTP